MLVIGALDREAAYDAGWEQRRAHVESLIRTDTLERALGKLKAAR